MKTLEISIERIKNIKKANLEFPLEKGVNLIVGSNGSGKSTILLTLSQCLKRRPLNSLKINDYQGDSRVEFRIDNLHDKWEAKNNWRLQDPQIKLNGLYEGSLFYGTRFDDSRRVDKLLAKGRIYRESIVDADSYMIEKMGYILHGDETHYKQLKKIKNRQIADKLGLRNNPYFWEVDGHLISQYRMSSGECLLVSLLHFIYNALVRKSIPRDQYILVLIDEIELALHPIAVSRFINLLNELVESWDKLIIILTSHSPEVIKKIKPKKIHQIENNNGEVSVINPGYPSYVIRDVYTHDGYDYLFLVEDDLAKILVDKILEINNLKTSKLIHVTPAGGWSNVLKLQRDLLQNNVLGTDKKIISIIDGDVENDIPPQDRRLMMLFLPVPSIEKFLLNIMTDASFNQVKKTITDKYFPIESLNELFQSFCKSQPKPRALNSKKFFRVLKRNLENRGITEKEFVIKIADDIIHSVSFDDFTSSISSMVSS